MYGAVNRIQAACSTANKAQIPLEWLSLWLAM